MKISLFSLSLVASFIHPASAAVPTEFETVLSEHLGHATLEDDCESRLIDMVANGTEREWTAAWKFIEHRFAQSSNNPEQRATLARVSVTAFLNDEGSERVSEETLRIRYQAHCLALTFVSDPQAGSFRVYQTLLLIRHSLWGMGFLTYQQLRSLCVIALMWSAQRAGDRSVPDLIHRIAEIRHPLLLPHTKNRLHNLAIFSERLENAERARPPSEFGERAPIRRPRRVH